MARVTRTTYEGYPGVKGHLGPLSFDLDWNRRFGVCLGWQIGGRQPTDPWVSGCLDWFAPLGEPNRLYLNGPRWSYMIGLPDNRHQEPTGRTRTAWSRSGPAQVPELREVTGRWRLTKGQRWTPDRQYWDREWRWITRHPRRYRTDR